MRLNDNRAAEESFRRAMALSPRDADTNHNLGWLLCQQSRYPDAQRSFETALSQPHLHRRARTLMAQGVCYARAGDAVARKRAWPAPTNSTPPSVAAYNLANLLYRRGENTRAQFIMRQLNNGEFPMRIALARHQVERRMNDGLAMRQLGEQLKKRFANSREAAAFERGAFDD